MQITTTTTQLAISSRGTKKTKKSKRKLTENEKKNLACKVNKTIIIKMSNGCC
jgi:hypothetical protein